MFSKRSPKDFRLRVSSYVYDVYLFNEKMDPDLLMKTTHRRRKRRRTLTSSHVDEVPARSLVNFNISLLEVMFVFPKREIAMLLTLEPDQRFAVTAALFAQT